MPCNLKYFHPSSLRFHKARYHRVVECSAAATEKFLSSARWRRNFLQSSQFSEHLLKQSHLSSRQQPSVSRLSPQKIECVKPVLGWVAKFSLRRLINHYIRQTNRFSIDDILPLYTLMMTLCHLAAINSGSFLLYTQFLTYEKNNRHFLCCNLALSLRSTCRLNINFDKLLYLEYQIRWNWACWRKKRKRMGRKFTHPHPSLSVV